MTKKELKKILKKAPKDADIKIRAYGYSQSMPEIFDIRSVQMDIDNYQVVIVIDD